MPPTRPLLLAVPNVSEGADRAGIDAIGAAFAPARLLDVHSDADHGRSVFWLAAEQGELASALLRGASAVLERVDLRAHVGLHPHVGALDVAPVVYLDAADRGAACAEALTVAALIGVSSISLRWQRKWQHESVSAPAGVACNGRTRYWICSRATVRSVAHFLLINSPTGANWRVPDGASPTGLRDVIREAMRAGEVIDVAVQTGDNPPRDVTLTVNGGAVATVAIVEVPL